jgi:hypothetical protein
MSGEFNPWLDLQDTKEGNQNYNGKKEQRIWQEFI